MGIRVGHDAPAGVIADAALIAGQGKYQKWAAQMQLERDKMAQQAAMQQASLAASAANAAAARDAAARQNQFDAAMRWNMLGAQQQFGLQNAMMNRGFQVADRDAGFAAAKDRMVLDAELDAKADARAKEADRVAKEAEMARLWEMDTIEMAEKEVSDLTAGMSKALPFMAPDDRRIYGEMAGKLRAIQKARGEMKPADYMKAIGQWQEEFAKSGVQERVEMPPTAEEDFDKNVVQRPEGLFARDRSGAWRQIQKPEAADTAKAPTFADRYADFDTFQKDYDAVAKQIMEEQEASDPKGTRGVAPPSRESVMKRMRERFDAFQEIQAQPQPAAPSAANPLEKLSDAQIERAMEDLAFSGDPRADKAFKMLMQEQARRTGEQVEAAAQAKQPAGIHIDPRSIKQFTTPTGASINYIEQDGRKVIVGQTADGRWVETGELVDRKPAAPRRPLGDPAAGKPPGWGPPPPPPIPTVPTGPEGDKLLERMLASSPSGTVVFIDATDGKKKVLKRGGL